MFPMVIGPDATPFTAPPADSIFSNINGRAFRGDHSFIATLRVLLKDRIHSEDNMTMTLVERPIIRTEGYPDVESLCHHIFGYTPKCEISIVNLSRRGELANAHTKAFDDVLSSADGFSLKSDISLLMEQTKLLDTCRIYVNSDRKSCIILVNNLSINTWHALQCLIPRMLPAYFADKRLTPQELELIGSLNVETCERYLELMQKMAEGIDFRGHLIRSIIGNAMTTAAENNIRNLEKAISQRQAEMEDLMSRYHDCVVRNDKDNATLAGYIIRKNAGAKDDELLSFLIQMDWFTPVQNNGNGFSFIVRTYLDMFDPDMFETMADNEDSHIWEAGYGEGFEDRLDRRLLLDAIFSNDAKFKINCCAYFNLDVRGTIDSYRSYTFPNALRDCIPNPHLNYFDCFGDHMPIIDDRIQAGDLMGAVMQCKTSASSLNVGESPTMRRFLEDLFTTGKRCIHLPDGRDVSPIEALNILKEVPNA